MALGAVLCVLFLYWFAASHIASTHGVWSPDCGARLIQVESLLQHWPHWWVSYPAAPLDPQHLNSSLYFYEYSHGGHTYVFYSFLFALLSAAFFRVLGYVGLAVLPMLGGVGTGLAVFGIARLLRFRVPVAPMLLVTLLTPLALYSIVFWDHSITTCIAAVCLYLEMRAVVTNRTWPWFVAGLALGGGLWLHEILIPYLPALFAGAWCARRQQPLVRSVGLLLAGAVLLVGPLALFNHQVYGTWSGPHLGNNHLGSTGESFSC